MIQQQKLIITVFLFIILPISTIELQPSNNQQVELALVPKTGKIFATKDNSVTWNGIYHNTRDNFYRNPGWGSTSGLTRTGAVPINTNIRIRLRTLANDVTNVQLRIWDGEHGKEILLQMTSFNSSNGYEYWETTIIGSAIPNDYYYVFIITDGTDIDYYNDDGYVSKEGRLQLDGGFGKMYDNHNTGTDYGIVFYDPTFNTPDWTKNSVGYQIFPDRFYNGDHTNDAFSSDITWHEWDSNGDGIFSNTDFQRVYATPKNWTTGSPSGGSDFFGGDLQGVTQKVQYLNDLGIDTIWFNPITESPDNHGYAVDNYLSIDPYLGSIQNRTNGVVYNDITKGLSVFDTMMGNLSQAGIKVIFDTVLNHVSAQSLYFQRFENAAVYDSPSGFSVSDPYSSVGAYESTASPYRNWFRFFSGNHNYDAWWTFRNIPTLKYDQTTAIETELISGPNSIFKFWLDHGVSGFRLDVNPDYDDGQGSRHINKVIRDAVKNIDPEAFIVGEVWERGNTWLTGTMNDAVQNMPFRDIVIDWLNGFLTDEKATSLLYFPQDSYSPDSFNSLLTILGNHDTARLLTKLGNDINKVKLASSMQFSYPGIPFIYYGDEVGLAGATDPDNRRPYPWGNENLDLKTHYQRLIKERKLEVSLHNGSFIIVPDNIEGIMTFGRNLDVSNANTYSLNVFNKNPWGTPFSLDLANYSVVKAGDELLDVLHGNKSYTVNSDLTLDLSLSGYDTIILIYNLTQNNQIPLVTTSPQSTSSSFSSTSSSRVFQESSSSSSITTTEVSVGASSSPSGPNTTGGLYFFIANTSIVFLVVMKRRRVRKS